MSQTNRETYTLDKKFGNILNFVNY